MGSRTAISTGVLAVALAALPVIATPASADECSNKGGLLSGVANGLCELLDGVTDTVDHLTGDQVKPVTQGVDEATGDVLGPVGDVLPTTPPTTTGPKSPSASPKSKPKTSQSPLEALDHVCLPVLACGDQSVLGKLTPTPTPAPRTDPPGESRERDEAQAVPTQAPAQPQNRPYLMDVSPRPVPEPPAVDEPRVELLWPNPFARELAVPLHDRTMMRPSPPASDVLGTALTIALLASAVLATRIVQRRRQDNEPAESIPFEPGRAGNGRHRLA
jgi:hypothetical protein